MSRLSILVIFCAALCFTPAESKSQSVVDLSSLLRYPPYYSALGYSRPASLSDSDYQRLLQISQQYNVKLSDLYQLYDLSCYNLPPYGSNEYINMIQQFAEAIELERIRRGLPCDHPLLRSSTSSSLVESIINTPYYPYKPAVLQKRGVMDDVDYLYDSGKEKVSNLYESGKETAGDLYESGKETAGNLYEDGKYAAKSLYKNLYNMMDYAISKPTQAFKNQINDIIYGNGIQDDINSAENFVNKITETLKCMI